MLRPGSDGDAAMGIFALTVLATFAGALSQESACVQSVQGTMLCCAAGDTACLQRQKAAHPADHEHASSDSALPGPWYAGASSTFSRFPLWDTQQFDLCVLGVPYSLSGTGAELAPNSVRKASRRLQPYHRGFKQSLKERGLRVVDADDLMVNRFDIRAAAREVEEGISSILANGRGCVILGGDHGITYGWLKAMQERHGLFALIHFDAHLDAHGTPLKWAVAQGVFDVRHSLHVGIRGTTASARDDVIDGELGFETITMRDAAHVGPAGVTERILKRLSRRDGTVMNAAILIDVDVVDPAFAPGVAEPEVGGYNVVDIGAILEGLQGAAVVVGGAVLGATPEADPSHVTSLATASIANDLLHLLAKGGTGMQPPPLPMPKDYKEKREL